MRAMQIFHRASAIIWPAVCASFFGPPLAFAQEHHVVKQNQTGFSLPGVHMPSGRDEVRAADGTTCSSAVSGNGAFVDTGVISGLSGRTDHHESLAVYGRIVVPLGKTPPRLDCRHLYELELRRLEMEVKMQERGLTRSGSTTGSLDEEFNDPDVWTTNARKGG